MSKVIRDLTWARTVATDLEDLEAEYEALAVPQGVVEAFLLKRTADDLASGVLKAQRWPLPRLRGENR